MASLNDSCAAILSTTSRFLMKENLQLADIKYFIARIYSLCFVIFRIWFSLFFVVRKHPVENQKFFS